MQLVERIEKLSTFVKNYDENNVFIESAVNKLIDYEKSKIENELTQLKFDLKEFEQKYKKKSEVFFKDFKSGKLGDEMDFIEWSSLYEMFLKNKEKVEFL